MNLSAPALLAAGHRLDDFDCGRPVLNQWLQRDARQAQGRGAAITLVVADGARVAAYMSLAIGQMDLLDPAQAGSRQAPCYPLPVMILSRLAVGKPAQGCGIGAGLLQEAVMRMQIMARQAGVRALLTHPLDPCSCGFFTRFGFISSPLQAQQLVLPCRVINHPVDEF